MDKMFHRKIYDMSIRDEFREEVFKTLSAAILRNHDFIIDVLDHPDSLQCLTDKDLLFLKGILNGLAYLVLMVQSKSGDYLENYYTEDQADQLVTLLSLYVNSQNRERFN